MSKRPGLTSVATAVCTSIVGGVAGIIAASWWPMWTIIAIVWLALLVFVIATRPRKRGRS